MSDSPPQKKNFDLINRGVKKPNLPGTLTFLGLRALDPFFQYKLLAGGWGASLLAKIGVNTIPLNAAALSTTGITLLDNLTLPLPHLILLGMSVGSFAKQAYWLLGLSAEEFPPSAAAAVSFYNTLVNSANSLLLIALSTSVLSSPRDFPGTNLPYQIVLGSLLYGVGMFIETASEWQRKQFKERPENKGKVMKGGLWSWARHINYGGYALWRAGYCMAASGFIGGTIMGVWQAVDFLTRGVPALNDYCSKRYGEQWSQFKREVKWTLLPGVY
ncbi:putative 7-dehydrocholesterol reductase [Colletotrichum chlorophyti]|uniref:Putative 7-dehydrocholesterol reductase n=1 Tax=Colletotrichum chlorophyti TaxID=708187 RepID=A0A1Q8S8C5_9PEZI|nr:putative 7-dehydrocholesterol reductase [Colletotrichum chlorophyti]